MRIPESDRELLWRCRILNEGIISLRNYLPEQKIIDILASLDADKLPKKVRKKIASILLFKNKLDTKQAELNKIILRAKRAADRIPDDTLRKVAKLYCFDCRSICEIAEECSSSKNTVYKHIRLLRESHKNV